MQSIMGFPGTFLRSAGSGAAALLALTLGAPSGSLAQNGPQTPAGYLPNTGHELLNLVQPCQDEACMSYVYGVIQGTSIYASLANMPSPFCASSEIGSADIQDALVNTIQVTPQLADAPAALSVLAAFSNYWPCVSGDEIEQISSEHLLPADPVMVEKLLASGGHAIDTGDRSAPANRTLIVFHDPNCSHCRRFRDESAELADSGWRVIVYPVAVSSEESTGYGAVELALRDIAPAATLELYENDPATVADIQVAMKLAEQLGHSSKDVLEAIARTGAYEAVQQNTGTFFEFGAQGTPAWIVGGSLYSGFLGADAISELASSMDVGEVDADAGNIPSGGG